MQKRKMLYWKREQGATLIEVMVSVLLLTFGVLALMVVQVRSVSGVSEAENRSVVAQAAEALAENMQINSTLVRVNTNGRSIFYRRYTDYLNAGSSVGNVSNLNMADAANQTKAQLAAIHLAEFQSILNTQIPNTDTIQYAICRDRSNPAQPTLNAGNIQANCNGDEVNMIKIIWRMSAPRGNSADNAEIYTYMLQVGN